MAFGFVYGITAIVSSKGAAFKKGGLKDRFENYVGGDEYAAPNRYDDGNYNGYSESQRKPAYGGGENIPMQNGGGDQGSTHQDYI